MTTKRPRGHSHQFNRGDKFGRWTILGPSRTDGTHRKWLCRCDCGAEQYVSASKLHCGRSGRCQRCVRKTHEMSKSPIYNRWGSMLSRCRNPANPAYYRYGGRGITVCEQWLDFQNFYVDMGNPPFPGASIERIDNNKGYEPSNCKWGTPKKQACNTRRTILINRGGRLLCLKDWCAELGLPYKTVHSRVAVLGWPVAKALSVPIRNHRRAG